MTVTISKAEYDRLIADSVRLDFIEKEWCEVVDGIQEIKITSHIMVGETKLRPALDKVMSVYKNLELNNDDWISVEESLPENNTKVLVCVENHLGCRMLMVTGFFDSEIGFYHDGNGIKVTHWQPLPPPPRE